MEGGHWADHEGLWRTADGEKFLLRVSTAVIMTTYAVIKLSFYYKLLITPPLALHEGELNVIN